VERMNITSESPWESEFGYSRAVRIGHQVSVAGSTATDGDGNVIGKGDAYEQAVITFRKIETALSKAGASMKDVYRTRMYVTDISDMPEIGRAHSEFFIDIKPAATLIEVSALASPDMLVEIEVDAMISE
jgi:enamine deaminase RidA (YjgF/YER057c/UK114 family)